ncbi:MAG: hypothetical protein ACYDD2_13080 [Candidatus Acidiferrales bacterium]
MELPSLYRQGDKKNAEIVKRQNKLLLDSKCWRRIIGNEVKIRAIAAEPDTINSIFAATTIQEMRKAFESSTLLTQRMRRGSSKPLRQLAKDATPLFKRTLRAVREAKRYRFPASDRNTSESKRLIHLASAIAGIECGISAASAIDKLRKLPHGKKCPCAPCTLDRNDSLEEIVNAIIKTSQERIEANAPMGLLYILSPRAIQRRSKRPTPDLHNGEFQMKW